MESAVLDRGFRQANVLATSFASTVLLLSALTLLQLVHPPPLGSAPLLSDLLFVLGIVQVLAAPIANLVLFRLRRTDPEQVARSFQRAILVSFALREAVAIYGFLLYVVCGDVLRCYTLCAAAFVAMIIAWPRRAMMEAKLRSS